MDTLEYIDVGLPNGQGDEEHGKQREPLPEALASFRRDLEREGHAFVDGATMRKSLGITSHDLQVLVEASHELEVDSYDPSGLRARAYSQAIYFPWADGVSWVPPFRNPKDGSLHTIYFQDPSVNPEAGGKERRLKPLPPHIRENVAVNSLIRGLFRTLPAWRIDGHGRTPVLVGFHISRLFCDGRRAALPSPREFHVDGEPHTFVVLLDRSPNAVGATSYVANRHCANQAVEDVSRADIIAERTLLNTLDTFVVDDAVVCHAVSGVRTDDCQPGWRTAIWVDFSVLKPARTVPPLKTPVKD